ncbi:aminomethyl-transferring glycine dehydrogenase subunit GcvPA [Thiospirillum jenense]|uniref:Probable glycine dehydrogenase (decarboxylating) subunit 1 n=1 Tax=Thiospirillum jenense TaxID=1653858 RepID=A0A839HBG6_9GAMM|nr:aminomethyl-transferring glycine dehydrogenase subunit GcvPA [Thiospirillum jenense]MBB1126333.1 aminomethyl-transferring glycine dehydrogenase subunit GcvPA [Thiospirillum jenense]
MPFIPHTDAEVAAMLATIGAPDLAALFDDIPADLPAADLTDLPPAVSEMEITRLMQRRARTDGQALCFTGAGAYDHHIPAAVWQLVERGEFYTAYTPYQAEASQGTLQVLYEFQSMMTALTALDASNASLYDGASALAEAILMAVRAQRQRHAPRILLPRSVHPLYRRVVQSIVNYQNIELVEVPFDPQTGQLTIAQLEAAAAGQPFAALVLPQPNFFGVIEEVSALTDWAHAQQAFVVGLVNPVALALLSPPGEWGQRGADIACGEGQPLGIPLASGGPYLGFLCCKQALVRQMPGRIVGKTLDRDGQIGYTLTLQAREQHIRRAKATSNICTNQGLLVTAATIHLALLGAEGLARVAQHCHANVQQLTQLLTAIPGVTRRFNAPVFHEQVLQLPLPAAAVLRSLAAHQLLGGYDLSDDYPELGAAVLICTTEQQTADDLTHFHNKLARVIAAQTQPGCGLKPN